ncbi:hypothetical protein ElyMa_003924700 [Elysia marginata]|uniref:Uncharacterized protein n=1 Tax=Elysia marginata TaxID=1093978 RepID=A0AAV4FQL3_9GAST|nr:hypothetical protein ElyMa_003924700 [Elysia marginata]
MDQSYRHGLMVDVRLSNREIRGLNSGFVGRFLILGEGSLKEVRWLSLAFGNQVVVFFPLITVALCVSVAALYTDRAQYVHGLRLFTQMSSPDSGAQ